MQKGDMLHTAHIAGVHWGHWTPLARLLLFFLVWFYLHSPSNEIYQGKTWSNVANSSHRKQLNFINKVAISHQMRGLDVQPYNSGDLMNEWAWHDSQPGVSSEVHRLLLDISH